MISGNLGNGIEIDGNSNAESTGNLIEGNYIGTDATGTMALANQMTGVAITAPGQPGSAGPAAGAGNLISGNVDDGVDVANIGHFQFKAISSAPI